MQFKVVRFLIGSDASKDQSQTDFWTNLTNMDEHFWTQQPASITVKLSEFGLFPAMKTLRVCLRCLWSRGIFPEFREPAV